MMGDDFNYNIRSRTPSVSSRQFVIPEDDLGSLETDNSSQESLEDNYDHFEGILESSGSDKSARLVGDQTSSTGDNDSQGTLLSQLVPQGNSFFTGNQVTPMFDTSKYLFESLTQAFNGVDFSEAIALQTKTSAIINSKSRELKMLIDETQERMNYFTEVFEAGGITSQKIKHNLQAISKKVEKLKPIFAREFPIEYNQAVQKVFDCSLDEEPSNVF